MAVLWRRPETGVWYILWWDRSEGKQRKRSCRTRDYNSAAEQLSDFRHELEKGPAARPGTLAALARDFMKGQKERGRTEDHVRNQQRQVDAFLEWCRKARIERPEVVSFEDVEKFLRGLLLKRLAPRTVNQYRGTLRLMFRLAQKRRHRRDNPCDLVDRVPQNQVEGDAWGRHRYLRMLAVARRTEDRIVVPLALAGLAGLRRGEIAGLRQDDVHLDRLALLVRGGKGPRGRKDRWVPIGHRLARILRAEPRLSVYMASHRHMRKRWGGWSPSGLTHAFRDFGALHGEPDLSPQICRRSFATWLAEAGVPPAVAARILGHSIQVADEHYVRIVPKVRKELDAL